MTTKTTTAKKSRLYNVCRDEKRLNGALDLLTVSRAGMSFIPSFMLPITNVSVVECDKRTADKIAAMIGNECFVKKRKPKRGRRHV